MTHVTFGGPSAQGTPVCPVKLLASAALPDTVLVAYARDRKVAGGHTALRKSAEPSHEGFGIRHVHASHGLGPVAYDPRCEGWEPRFGRTHKLSTWAWRHRARSAKTLRMTPHQVPPACQLVFSATYIRIAQFTV